MGDCERQKLYIRPVGIPQAYLYLSWNLFKVFMVFFGIVSNKSFEEIFSLFLQNSFNRTIKPLSPLNVKHRLFSHCNYSHSVSNRKANNSCFEFSILTFRQIWNIVQPCIRLFRRHAIHGTQRSQKQSTYIIKPL